MAGVAQSSERESFWRGHIESWGSSGVSIRGYCHEHGLSEASFHAWRRELRRRDETAACSSAARFVEVKGVALRASDAPLEVLVSGRVIRVHPGFDAETLAGVVRVLDALGASC